MFWLLTFVIYWLLLFVACYIVVEVAQSYFYDEITPYAPLKVGGSTLLMAIALTWKDPVSLDLFVDDAWFTALLAIAAFVLFVLAMRFHPPHALLLGPLTVIVVAFAAAMAIESLQSSGRAGFRDRPVPPEQRTIRKSTGGAAIAPTEEPAP